MHGHFSTKSDVFSFGVLVLEIVSGRRNTSFQYEESAQDLLGYVCKHEYLYYIMDRSSYHQQI